jgi:hypothetical protein
MALNVEARIGAPPRQTLVESLTSPYREAGAQTSADLLPCAFSGHLLQKCANDDAVPPRLNFRKFPVT